MLDSLKPKRIIPGFISASEKKEKQSSSSRDYARNSLIGYDDKLILVKRLINISGENIAYSLEEIKYGNVVKSKLLAKSLMIISQCLNLSFSQDEKSGNITLIKKIKNRLYELQHGKTGNYKILTQRRGKSFLLKPMNIYDHVKTPFIKIKKDERGENLLRLKIRYHEKNRPGKNCTLLIQDNNFNNLLSLPCHGPTEKLYPDRYEKVYATLLDGIERIRINIYSIDKTPTYLPEEITLEHTVLLSDDLAEAEKKETDRILKVILQQTNLTTFRDNFGLPNSNEAEYEKLVESYSKEMLQEFFKDDPWFANYIVNIWEFVHGETVLTTYPWNICIPIADTCNATCLFCNSWIRGKRQLNPDESRNFLPLLRNARFLGFAGHGEPLIHTQFEKIALQIHKDIDPRCSIYLVTNGVLLERYLKLLIDINVRTFNISLNAATAETYKKVMGLGKTTFDKVISCLERLVEIRDNEKSQYTPAVNISLVVTNQNIHEVASFIELGNRLKVNRIHLNTLMPQSHWISGLNYHTLPPYLNPGFTRFKEEALRAIAASNIKVLASPETWEVPVFPQHLEKQLKDNPPPPVDLQEVRKNLASYTKIAPLPITKGCPLTAQHQPEETLEEQEENPYGRGPRYDCRFVYHVLNLNDFFFRLNPCCYMWDVPGFEPMVYDGSCDFFEIWNSPAMVELRNRLKEGPLYSHCRRCPPQAQTLDKSI